MLINFTLVPVEEITPWGAPDDLWLSWFGLTDGQYWLEAGEGVLFEYSECVRSRIDNRYCDYQVVRLHEDLMDMLPAIWEPVPGHLVRYLSGDASLRWSDAVDQWCASFEACVPEERYWAVVEGAVSWRSDRRLDNGYLSPSANIVIWSDVEHVHIEWDSRDKLFEGHAAWTAVRGSFKLTRDEFMREVQSFHARLMDQMGIRVKQVAAGALKAEIRIDLAALEADHEKRCGALSRACSTGARTDWQQVEQAIQWVQAQRR